MTKTNAATHRNKSLRAASAGRTDAPAPRRAIGRFLRPAYLRFRLCQRPL